MNQIIMTRCAWHKPKKIIKGFKFIGDIENATEESTTVVISDGMCDVCVDRIRKENKLGRYKD